MRKGRQKVARPLIACRAILADPRHEVWAAMLATFDEKQRRKSDEPPHRHEPAHMRDIHSPNLQIDTNGMKARNLL
jgi:hypothetical protein